MMAMVLNHLISKAGIDFLHTAVSLSIEDLHRESLCTLSWGGYSTPFLPKYNRQWQPPISYALLTFKTHNA